MISPEFLAILANPLEPDRPPLRQEGSLLICTKTGVAFPIIDGIPRLLPEHVIPADKIAEYLEQHPTDGANE